MNRIAFPVLLLAVLLAATGCATAAMTGTADGDRAYSTASEDARITRDVRTGLYRDTMIGGSRIQVSTSRGIVTLRGVVDNRLHVSRALEIAESVDGVRGVNIELRVKTTP